MNPFTKGKTASRTGNAVLKDADIRRIRQLAKAHTTRDIAEAFGVGMETIRKIVRRDSWKWVADELDLDRPIPPVNELDLAAADASLRRVQEKLEDDKKPTGVAKLNDILHRAVEPGLAVMKELESVEAKAASFGVEKKNEQ